MKKNVYCLIMLAMLFALSGAAWGDVFITELADPNNNSNARYIELYNNGVSTVDFTEGSGWKINKYTNGSATVSKTLSLTGTIGAGGFYIIAYDISAGTFLSVYGQAADQLDAVSDGVAGSNGDDTFELVDGTGTVVDFYGVQPHSDLTGTIWEYEDGRAERAKGATTGKNPPEDADWNTWSDGPGGDVVSAKNAPDDFDPGAWIGGAASPTITLSTTSLSNFTYVVGHGPSAEQSFTVEGSDLTANISIAPPTNYEISTTTGEAFSATNPITLTHSDGTVASTTIYVRLKAGLGINSYNGESISATSSGATTKTVVCDGAVTETTPVEPTAGGLIISEVVGDNADETNDDGFMEIYNNTSSTINLNNVQARYYNTNPGDVSYTQNLSGSIEAGDYIVVTQNNTNFMTEYGFAADFANGSFYFNGGDDGVDVYHTSNGVLDQFNEVGAGTSPWTWSDANVFERTSLSSGALITSWTEITTGNGTPNSGNDNSLPVELQEFNAIPGNSKVILSWTTESETENLGFILSRKVKGESTKYEEIAGYMTDKALEGHGSTTERHEYSYTDYDVINGVTYSYKITDVDYSGTAKMHNIVVSAAPSGKAENTIADGFHLHACYPNPFNPETTLHFELNETADVWVQVYDVLGNLVTTLTNTTYQPGEYSLTWNGRDANNRLSTTGIYFLRVSSSTGFSSTQKIVLLK